MSARQITFRLYDPQGRPDGRATGAVVEQRGHVLVVQVDVWRGRKLTERQRCHVRPIDLVPAAQDGMS